MFNINQRWIISLMWRHSHNNCLNVGIQLFDGAADGTEFILHRHKLSTSLGSAFLFDLICVCLLVPRCDSSESRVGEPG